MDPEQLVARLTELRTQNQQLHQALQQSLAQTVGAAVAAATNPARADPTMVDTKGLGKPPSCLGHDAQRTSTRAYILEQEMS